jgi:hypothetical protein
MNINYNANDNVFYHLYQHTLFGLAPHINRYGNDKNWVEKLGDLGLWTIENFPGKMWSLMKEPRWITLALTQIALATTSYLFYPKETLFYAKAAIEKLPLPTRETVKFAAYLTVVAHIISAALRAYGRFRNEELMDDWYNGGHAVMVGPHGGAIPIVVGREEDEEV